MSRQFGVPVRSASGGNHRADLTTAPDTQRGNVISLADHFPSRGDRLNSERLTVAPSFIREFAAWCFVIIYVNIPALFVAAAVVIYALFIA
jgi:hypothetical protein